MREGKSVILASVHAMDHKQEQARMLDVAVAGECPVWTEKTELEAHCARRADGDVQALWVEGLAADGALVGVAVNL